jgi:hypothetical protein
MTSLLPPIAVTLFELAAEFADFSNDHTELLDFEQYADLQEAEVKLRAYGNLFSTFNRELFLRDEINEAAAALEYHRSRIEQRLANREGGTP